MSLTVKQLKQIVRDHKTRNCPAYSKLRKAELMTLVRKIAPHKIVMPPRRKQRKIKKMVKLNPAKKLKKRGKKFKSSTELSKPVRKIKKKNETKTLERKTSFSSGVLSLSPNDIKQVDDFIFNLTGLRGKAAGSRRRTLIFGLSDLVEANGIFAQGDNPGGLKTIVKFWLQRLPDDILNDLF